jgi:methylenetetrahydrofolate reductase (NADPH)
MKIIDLSKTKKPVISFEIFPPKLDTPLDTIFDALEQFKVLKPDYISITYGAGGSQKDRTIEIASKIKRDYNIESMAHFTCVGHSVEEIDSLLDSLKENNIDNILALRGDAPADQPDFDFGKNAFKHANELIKYIRSKTTIYV